MKILGWIAISFYMLIGFTAWCCIAVGARADKSMKKDLERPDLIQLKK